MVYTQGVKVCRLEGIETTSLPWCVYLPKAHFSWVLTVRTVHAACVPCTPYVHCTSHMHIYLPHTHACTHTHAHRHTDTHTHIHKHTQREREREMNATQCSYSPMRDDPTYNNPLPLPVLQERGQVRSAKTGPQTPLSHCNHSLVLSSHSRLLDYSHSASHEYH